jgi:hypothetical protein
MALTGTVRAILSLIPFTPDQSLFQIASITKGITATAIMQLRDKGLLKLDEHVNKLLKFPVRIGCDGSPTSDGLGRISRVLEGVLIPLRRPPRLMPAHVGRPMCTENWIRLDTRQRSVGGSQMDRRPPGATTISGSLIN